LPQSNAKSQFFYTQPPLQILSESDFVSTHISVKTLDYRDQNVLMAKTA